MNANQLINMIVRQITRVVISKGINAGMKGAGNAAQKMRNKRADTDDVYIDDYGNTVKRKPTKRS